jgi:hypothetical protein
MKTVWVCINPAKEVADVDHLKVFARRSRFNDYWAFCWFSGNPF